MTTKKRNDKVPVVHICVHCLGNVPAFIHIDNIFIDSDQAQNKRPNVPFGSKGLLAAKFKSFHSSASMRRTNCQVRADEAFTQSREQTDRQCKSNQRVLFNTPEPEPVEAPDEGDGDGELLVEPVDENEPHEVAPLPEVPVGPPGIGNDLQREQVCRFTSF